jgi:hypothetical protein
MESLAGTVGGAGAGLARASFLAFLCLAFGAGAGCTGKVLAPGSNSGVGSSPGSAGNGNGSGAGGAGPGVTPQAGAAVVRRLNRMEYNNTVKDLLGTTLAPANDFPDDDLGGEFDTVGEALSLSPTYVAGYEKAAYALVTDLLAADATRRGRIITCDVTSAGDACAQTILSAFARRAWRRPVTADEVQTLMTPIAAAKTAGATAAEGLQYALATVLLSPFFIFKPEILADPNSTQPQRLGPYELATRLSYALWSSMPDDALSAAADAGQLAADAQLATQIDRMLADPRADALLDAFAGQWLAYRALPTHEVEATAFPQFTPALANSMALEARRFVQEFLRSDRPVTEMLTARFTFVDASLATLYGITRPAGSAAGTLVRVDTTTAPRSGILTLGAFLTGTSLPSRTSPVKRGEFVFNRLLCQTIGQPPPDVPPLSEGDTATTLTLRQRMEEHRKNPACSPCHSLMDPIGFGLENYDAIGRYRTTDVAGTIDASGVLPDGTSFNGAVDMAGVLGRDARFSDCVTRKFMTFAVGRLLNQPTDGALVASLATKARAASGSFTSIVRQVLLSDGFRSRQGRPGP